MAEEKGPLKSAVELALERLKRKDEEAGVTARALSDADKTAIAEIRNFYEAKLAQEDVLHQSKLRTVTDPAERELLAAQFRRERERLVSEREAKIAKIRAGERSGQGASERP